MEAEAEADPGLSGTGHRGEVTSRSQMQIYPASGFRVALLDLGAKENMIRSTA